jgi:hypothetical protein
MDMSHYQNAGQNHNLLTSNTSFENVEKFKYLRTTVTKETCIQKYTKSKLNEGNTCYHFVRSLLSSHLLSTNLQTKIYKTIILPVVLYGCETVSHTKGGCLRTRY